jgi:hypothetical protein
MAVNSVRLSPETEEKLATVAAKARRTKSWLINEAVKNHLVRLGRDERRWEARVLAHVLPMFENPYIAAMGLLGRDSGDEPDRSQLGLDLIEKQIYDSTAVEPRERQASLLAVSCSGAAP